jgi:hypothetical protein
VSAPSAPRIDPQAVATLDQLQRLAADMVTRSAEECGGDLDELVQELNHALSKLVEDPDQALSDAREISVDMFKVLLALIDQLELSAAHVLADAINRVD